MSSSRKPIWGFLSGTVNTSFRHATRLLRQLRPEDGDRLNEHIGALFMAVVKADPVQTDEETAFIGELFTATFGRREGMRVYEVLKARGSIDIEAECRFLKGLGREEVEELVQGMVEVGNCDGEISELEQAVIYKAAAVFGLESAVVERCMAEVRSERDRRQSVVRSGAGILVAIVVVLIFVFVATFLRSVLFGLILAYFFLPLQRWYQYRFFSHPLITSIFRLSPPEDRESRRGIACRATLLSSALLLLGGLGGLLLVYTVFFAPSDDVASVGWLEQFRPQLDAIPFVGEARQAIRAYLEDPHSKEELVKMALGHVQSILLQAGGVFMGVMHVLLDIMLTVFFFGFFLQRIAAGQSDELGRQKPTGQYIVEAIFESGWMPDMRSSTLREAQIIIDDMLGMLQVWVRGYLWIILVETFLYTTIFMVLRVPFFALAGLVAGSTILLPVVGPLVGCSVTVLATLAVNPHGVTPAVGVMVAYLVIHGMLEQLFLYPSLVGQALGLNTLETIIVVLLGGLLAGLPGIIFAVPAAAIVKRLVPKIYAALRSRKGAENAEGAEGAESAF